MSAFREVILSSKQNDNDNLETSQGFNTNNPQAKISILFLHSEKIQITIKANSILFQIFPPITNGLEINLDGEITNSLIALKKENKLDSFIVFYLIKKELNLIEISLKEFTLKGYFSKKFKLPQKFYCIEYIKQEYESFWFLLGSKEGIIQILRVNLEKENFELTQEIKKSSWSAITLTWVTRTIEVQSPIIGIKKFIDNYAFFIRMDTSFGLFDTQDKKCIYSDKIILSKLYTLNSTKIALGEPKNIPNIEGRYYNIIQVALILNSLETSELYTMEIVINSTNNFVEIKNKRSFPFDKPILDIEIFQNKLWVVISPSDSQNLEDIKLIWLDKASEDNNDIIEPLAPYIYNEPIIDFQEKRLMNLIYILNQEKNLTSNSKLNKMNSILYPILTEENIFSSEKIQNCINRKFSINLTNKREITNFLRDQYLKEPSESSINEDILTPLIKEDLFNNKIIGLASYKGEFEGGVALIRANGVSLFKKAGIIEQMEMIAMHFEYQIRKILFEIEKNKTDIYYEQSVDKEISLFVSREISENSSNSLFVILALLRVYLTEEFLLLNNITEIEKYFNNNDKIESIDLLNNFINKFFSENLQFPSYPSIINYSLSFFHQIIYDIYISNQKDIEKGINNIILAFDNLFEASKLLGQYKYEQYYRAKSLFSNQSNLISPYKVIDNIKFFILLIKENLSSVFNLSRDLLAFFEWKKVFKYDIKSINFINDSKIRSFFFNMLSCFQVWSTISQNEKRISTIEWINNSFQLEQNNNRAMTIIFNNFINLIIFSQKCTNLIRLKFLFDEEPDLLRLITLFQNEDNNLESIFILILLYAKSHIENKFNYMKTYLNIFYMQLMNPNLKHNDLEQIQKFNNILSIFEYEHNFPILRGFIYVINGLRYIKLKEDEIGKLYLFSFPFVFPALEKGDDIQTAALFEDYLLNSFENCISCNIQIAKCFWNYCQKRFKDDNSDKKKAILQRFIDLFTKFFTEMYNNKTPNDTSFLSLYDTQFLFLISENIKKKTSLNNLLLQIAIYKHLGKFYESVLVIQKVYREIIKTKLSNTLFLTESILFYYRKIILLLTNGLEYLIECSNDNHKINQLQREFEFKKKLYEVKYFILHFYLINKAHLQNYTEQFTQINSNERELTAVLEIIFEFELNNIGIKSGIVNYLLYENEKYSKAFIYNMIVLLTEEKLYDELDDFIDSILNFEKSHENKFILLEYLLIRGFDNKIGKIIKCLRKGESNELRLMELLLKYQKYEWFIELRNTISSNKKFEFPNYLNYNSRNINIK